MRVIYFDIDSLRPDHLGCYGYQRNTSPVIDSLAKQGVRFNNCYCSDAPCLPSRTALTSGRFGIHTGVVGHGGTAADVRLQGENRGFRSSYDSHTMAGFFRNCGYKTALFSSFAERHSAWQFYAGFNEIVNVGKCGMEDSCEVIPYVHKWLDEHAKEDNWFIHINLWDVHFPARVPMGYGDPYKDSPLPEGLDESFFNKIKSFVGIQNTTMKSEVAKRYRDGFYHGAIKQVIGQNLRNPEKIATLEDFKMLIDGYDCSIKYIDDDIGDVCKKLQVNGVLDETAVIVSADHGENFGELGICVDHVTADYATNRIPLIIKWPGMLRDSVDEAFHYNLDLLPTLAELMGEECSELWDGKSYADTLKQGEENGWEYLILGQGAGTCQRAVRFDKWIYIKTYHDGYNMFDEEMLFDVSNDPLEQENVISQFSDIACDARAKLARWYDKMMSTMPDGYTDDPMRTVIKEGGPAHVKGSHKAYLERLDKEGFEKEATEFRRRHPNE